MPLVLAIEPDPRQASILERVVREQVRAELVLVDSKDAAIAALRTRIPDVILITTLLPPRDEQDITEHLKTLEHTEHLQTVTIPVLASNEDGGHEGGGLFTAFRRKRRPRTIDNGCDQRVFGEQVQEYLQRAAEVRALHGAASPAPEVPPQPLEDRSETSPASSENRPDAVDLPLARLIPFATLAPLRSFLSGLQSDAPVHRYALLRARQLNALLLADRSALPEQSAPGTSPESNSPEVEQQDREAPKSTSGAVEETASQAVEEATSREVEDANTGEVEQPTGLESKDPELEGSRLEAVEDGGSQGAVPEQSVNREPVIDIGSREANADSEPNHAAAVECAESPLGTGPRPAEPGEAPSNGATLDLTLWDRLFVALEERLGDDTATDHAPAENGTDATGDTSPQKPRKARTRRPRKRRRVEMPETLPSVGVDGQWLASEIAALRRALEKLQRDNAGTGEEETVAPSVEPREVSREPAADAEPLDDEAGDSSPREARAPVQDEWGFYDPDQCGMAALRARLANPLAAWAHAGHDASPADLSPPPPARLSSLNPAALADHAFAVRYASGVRIRRVRVARRDMERADDKQVVILSRKALRKGG